MNQIIRTRIDDIKAGRVPQGYKKTPCGVLPCEWNLRKLHQVFDRNNNRNAGNVVSNVLTISAQQGLISQTKYFNKDIASEDRKNYLVLKKDSFAYNKSYSTGYPFGAIKRLKYYDTGILSPLYICFDHKKDLSNLDFYEQYFESGAINHQINNYAQEGARNHGSLNLSIGDFFNSQLAFPPLLEQEKIAEIFGTWDNAIDKQMALIAKLESRKKSLMQKLFTPKDGWKKVKLKDVSFYCSSNLCANKVDNFAEGKYPIFDANKVIKYWNDYLFDKRYISIIKDGAGVGRIVVCQEKSSIIGTMGAIFNRETIVFELLYAILQCINFREYITGSTIPHIYYSKYSNYKFNLPVNIQDQQKIADILTSADSEIDKHRKKFEQIKQQKKSLMQLLLSGIVRVNGN